MPEVEELAAGEPEKVVIENARRKLLAVADTRRPGGLAVVAPQPPPPRLETVVLAADTIVVLDDQIYGKPADRREAESMLRLLAGRVHRVLTGVAIGDRSGVAITSVRFRALDEGLLAWYLDSDEWRGRAGAYAIQGRGAAFVEAIYGDYLNVVGLPVTTLLQLEPTLLTQD